MNLKFLMTLGALVFPLSVSAQPLKEMSEGDFLDLVDKEGAVLVQGLGVDGVNAKARNEGAKFPALGYWSLEGICFQKPARGECNGVFQR